MILGRDPNDRFGAALSLGDVNQDGYEDIAVASSAGDGPIDDRDRAGEVAVILGGEMPPDTLDLAVEDPPYLLYAPGGLDSMGWGIQQTINSLDVETHKIRRPCWPSAC